jgi:hypothetical protein
MCSLNELTNFAFVLVLIVMLVEVATDGHHIRESPSGLRKIQHSPLHIRKWERHPDLPDPEFGESGTPLRPEHSRTGSLAGVYSAVGDGKMSLWAVLSANRKLPLCHPNTNSPWVSRSEPARAREGIVSALRSHSNCSPRAEKARAPGSGVAGGPDHGRVYFRLRVPSAILALTDFHLGTASGQV